MDHSINGFTHFLFGTIDISFERLLCFYRKKDEELDIIVVAAQVLLSSLTWSHGVNKEGDESSVDNLQRASVLALFVSNCFGGSDRSNAVVKARKAVSGSNYEQPFICTCLGLKNNTDNEACSSQSGLMDDFNFIDLCEKSIELIKRKKKSNIVPIGSLRFGICRHRALLMKASVYHSDLCFAVSYFVLFFLDV